MTHWRRIAIFVSILASVAFTPTGRAGTIQDKTIGYSIFAPSGFGREVDAGFESYNFRSDYYLLDVLTSKDKLTPKTGWLTYSRRMALFYFPSRTAADIAKLREEREKAKEKKSSSFDFNAWLSLDRVYQNFEEYAKDYIQGFYFSEQKAAKHAGFDCTVYEMSFEKLTQIPERWLACAYKVPGGEFVVVFTCTDQHFKKYRGEMTKTFGTFRLLDANGLTARDPHNTVNSKAEIGSDGEIDPSTMTPDEKAAHWSAVRKKAFDQTKQGLEKGWDCFETANFLVCHDGDAKNAKDASRHAEAVITWLADRFGGIGTNPTQAMILKLFTKSDRPTLTAIRVSNDPAAVKTVTVYRDWNGKFTLASVADEVMWNWFDQKNPDLSKRMPWWLRSGLSGMMRDTAVKANKLDFAMDSWERESMSDALRADRDWKGKPEDGPLKPMRLLLNSTGQEIYSKDFSWGAAQCASTVRYFLEGPGGRNEKTRSTLQHYIGHLSELVAEVEARLEAEKKAEEEQKKLEENLSDEERLKLEDEAYKKKRENEYGKIEKELLDGAFGKTFRGWTDADWKTLDDQWLTFAKSRVKSK